MATADIAVIGGGVVGCAVFFELNRLGFSCILLEKNKDLMSEASSGNSGMLHTGFDAPKNSLELHCIKRSQERVLDVFDKLGVPYSKNGSVMVAWNLEQVCKLEEILSSSSEKSIQGLSHLTLTDLYQKEPNLSRRAQGALWIPEETILDPFIYGILLAHHARKNGGQILTNCEVTQCCVSDDNKNVLATTRGQVTAKVVINCAGLFGDKVQQLAGIDTFTIKPRKGQFVVFGQRAGRLINSSILPVPSDKSKGIIIFRTVYNNLIVGPTAEDVESRERAPLDDAITLRLLEYGHQVLPDLTSLMPCGHYVGLRPATQFKDYQIQGYMDRNWITVGGIRSTGVSASLGIAEYVASLVQRDMMVEPVQSSTSALEHSEWSVLPDGRLLVGEFAYGITHPITQYGASERYHLSRL